MPTTLTDANVFEYLADRFPAALGSGGDLRRVQPAGDGNINWVRRISAGETSYVVKQAGPALQKFPEYAVSPERILHEARYYATVAGVDREAVCPVVHFVDPENHVLVLEDLGPVERLDAALQRDADSEEALCRIARFLGTVHASIQLPEELLQFPDPAYDQGVLRLHFEHIFRLPFEPNDFPLSPAVRAEAETLMQDTALRGAIERTRSQSEIRSALIHGDVQPTNILLAARGAVLLDAEIAHAGAPAFDLGLLLAHVVIACAARRRLGEAAARVAPLWQAYRDADEDGPLCAFGEVAAVAGVEMLRRTLGAARVPEVNDDDVAREVLRVGQRLLRERPASPAALAELA